MCGIAGFVEFGGFEERYGRDVANLMADALLHRGPDSFGIWLEPKFGIALAHRRLSVVDLSDAGQQPMSSPNGRYKIVFNGEIYNHLALRNELEEKSQNYTWSGQTDTETLLNLIEVFGLEQALKKLVGMFAFAVFDEKDKSIYLARDRIGEKPLYYGVQGKNMFFASELKSICVHPKFHKEINPTALSDYLNFNYVPQPLSIFNNVFKLKPGHFLKLAPDCKPIEYWSRQMNKVSVNSFENWSDTEVLLHLEQLLSEAVNIQTKADVPIGAFLSGGVDSSLIVALMQELSRNPVKSFTLGFSDDQFDEAPFAKTVAEHLKTDHTEVYVNSNAAREVIPKLPGIYDEPFSDSSQIPSFLISKIAKADVTVCLSGDGADELFGGYNRYNFGARSWGKISMLPSKFRNQFSKGLTSVNTKTYDEMFLRLGKFLPPRFTYTNVGDKIHKFSYLLNSNSKNEFYSQLVSNWGKFEAGAKNEERHDSFFENYFLQMDGNFAEQMMSVDLDTYLPDDILVKVDRAAMAVSLETRAPFLDHRVVEFANSLPLRLKIRNGKGKYCLRRILYNKVPQNLVERPKMGFGVPLGSWLRGPLKDWAYSLLESERIKKSGYLNSDLIQEIWLQHTSGERNWQYRLWNILMFEAWREEQGL